LNKERETKRYTRGDTKFNPHTQGMHIILYDISTKVLVFFIVINVGRVVQHMRQSAGDKAQETKLRMGGELKTNVETHRNTAVQRVPQPAGYTIFKSN
jgi:hypothetical protein